MKNFHTMSNTIKKNNIYFENGTKGRYIQAEESILSPFAATLFGLSVSLKVVAIRKELKHLYSILRTLKYIIALHFD